MTQQKHVMSQSQETGLRDSISSKFWGLQISGQLVPGSEGASFPVFDPADTLKIADVADATIADGLAAISAAEAAADDWSRTAPRKRSDILMRCWQLMTERAEWLAQLISMENGKALPDARGEVAYAAEFFRWYAEEGVRVLGEVGHAPGGANRILVQHRPIGISVLVTPWNFPAAMATRKIAPALAAGCTCVLKPAAETPLTALAIGEIMTEAGVPAGVVNIVTTTRAGDVVGAMLQDPRVRKLSFTGSTQVGRVLLRQAADQVISCSMELGGNAPFVVMDDADLDLVIPQAMLAKMRNGGEACTAANRFIVQRGIHDAFVERIGKAMAAIKVGRGLDADVECGPLVNPASVAKVRGLVDDALGKGARLVSQAALPDSDGWYYAPTVLADIPRDARIWSEEIFGPVVAVTAFDTEDEAIGLANETEYGLISYVFSGDLGRALRIGERIESGMVAVNRGLASDPAAPFGGMKQSGLGREGSHHGLMEYVEPQYFAVSW